MKGVKKLIKNKVLINTFNRAKNKNYLNKRSVCVLSYILLKFKKNLKKSTKKKLFIPSCFLVNVVTKKFFSNKIPLCVIKLSIFLLYVVYIKSYKPTTSTVRFKKSMFLVKFKKICKNFKFFTKNNSGRNNSGILTLYSKASTKNKKVNILTSPPWDKHIYKIVSFIRGGRGILSLCKHSGGSISLIPHISGVNINQTVFSTVLPKKYWFNNFPGSYVMLRFLGRFSIFSNIFAHNYGKVANSAGTFCQLIDYFNDFNLIKVSLPSKTCVFLSGYCFVLLGKNSQTQKRFCFIGKAGTNKNIGHKPKVRGVARNPVDHPHGGRTKTNKPEVSIWGWVAKKNK